MIERRQTKRLTAYWERIKKSRDIPLISSFNPQAVDDLWQSCFQVSVEKEGGKVTYTYRYIGKNLEEIFGSDMLNRQVTSNMKFIPAKQIIVTMDDMVANPAPAFHNGQFVDPSSHLIKYRSCILPFGPDREHVTHFIVGLSWNSFN